jgi:hypothetical protein
MTDIVAFYQGKATDAYGRLLQDIWQADDQWLEDVHNYIQTLFPNQDPSKFNASAPLVDRGTIAAFQKDATLRDNLAKSLDVMLRFYGLQYRPNSQEVVQREDFPRKAANWLNPYNHNFLRITRILKCLMALGLPERAEALFRYLQELYQQHREEIGEETMAYWTDAIAPA